MIKRFRDYARSHNLIILAFLKEKNSGEVFGVAIEKDVWLDREPIYSFGKLYNVYANVFQFDRQGTFSSTNYKEVKLRAYDFFGIK